MTEMVAPTPWHTALELQPYWCWNKADPEVGAEENPDWHADGLGALLGHRCPFDGLSRHRLMPLNWPTSAFVVHCSAISLPWLMTSCSWHMASSSIAARVFFWSCRLMSKPSATWVLCAAYYVLPGSTGNGGDCPWKSATPATAEWGLLQHKTTETPQGLTGE